MSQVNAESEEFTDVYSRDIIAEARRLSPAIDEYVVTQQYLLETAQENLSPEWLRNRLVRLVLDELTERGLSIAMDVDAILDAPELVYNSLTLRAKFDEEKLFEMLRHRYEMVDDLRELVGDDCLDDLIEYFNKALPLDEGWESLARLNENRPGLLSSSGEFVDMFNRVFERIDRLGEPGMEDLVGEKFVVDYAQALAERKRKIGEIAEAIYFKGRMAVENSEIRTSIIKKLMVNFEAELARPRYVEEFSKSEKPFAQFVQDVRVNFLKRWKHSMEYWLDAGHVSEMPNELEMALLVATLYVDAPDQTQARVNVVAKFEENIDIIGPRAEKFRQLLDNALSNLVILNDGGLAYGTK